MSHFDKPVFEVEKMSDEIERFVDDVGISPALKKQVLDEETIGDVVSKVALLHWSAELKKA